MRRAFVLVLTAIAAFCEIVVMVANSALGSRIRAGEVALGAAMLGVRAVYVRACPWKDPNKHGNAVLSLPECWQYYRPNPDDPRFKAGSHEYKKQPKKVKPAMAL